MYDTSSHSTKEREEVEAAVTVMLAEALARRIANQVIESIKLAE